MLPFVQTDRGTPSPKNAARRNTTLLLVDDEPLICEVLKTVLAMEGYTVLTAENGQAALALASRVRVDMLITDFQMPMMDGYALATLLTDAKPALPVLLISGADPGQVPLAQLNARKWGYLAKPLNNDRLLAMIDSECALQAAKSEGFH